jgi:hypothetical protein
VTIRRIDADIFHPLPPARLYLDDLEKVVRILVEAIENRKEEADRRDESARTKVTLTVKGLACDEVKELKDIAKKTTELNLKVERGWGGQSSLTLNTYYSAVTLIGFTREEQLRVLDQIAPIFKLRNLWFATLYYSNKTFRQVLFPLFSVALAIAAWTVPFNKVTPLKLRVAVMLPFLVLNATVFVVIVTTAFRHSTIILRYSSERSAIRQEMVSKGIPIVVASILSFILGLLTLYLKHKYWP